MPTAYIIYRNKCAIIKGLHYLYDVCVFMSYFSANILVRILF